MTTKRIGITNKYFSYGWIYGFGIGLNINRHVIDLQLGFWYVGFEF